MTSSLNSIVEKAKYLTELPPRTMIKIKTAGKFDRCFDLSFFRAGISKKHRLTGGPAWVWTGIAAPAEPVAGSGSDACEERAREKEWDRGQEKDES